MTILLRMDDKMNRQLTCSITDADTAISLSQELVHFGFINEVQLYYYLQDTTDTFEWIYNNTILFFQADKDKILVIIEETLSEGPQCKEDDQSSVVVDHNITPSKLQKQSSINTVSCSTSSSLLRPSVIRSPIKRDGS